MKEYMITAKQARTLSRSKTSIHVANALNKIYMDIRDEATNNQNECEIMNIWSDEDCTNLIGWSELDSRVRNQIVKDLKKQGFTFRSRESLLISW